MLPVYAGAYRAHRVRSYRQKAVSVTRTGGGGTENGTDIWAQLGVGAQMRGVEYPSEGEWVPRCSQQTTGQLREGQQIK